MMRLNGELQSLEFRVNLKLFSFEVRSAKLKAFECHECKRFNYVIVRMSFLVMCTVNVLAKMADVRITMVVYDNQLTV
jgi:hypothetical protein